MTLETFRYNGNDVPFGTISHGTLRAEDLIPRFYAELSQNEKAKYDAIDWEPMDGDAEKLDHLHDELNRNLPVGVYFGAHPGDGSDFGYWPEELLD